MIDNLSPCKCGCENPTFTKLLYSKLLSSQYVCPDCGIITLQCATQEEAAKAWNNLQTLEY